ncbi:MAG: TonB-dependent receptor [Pseudomonadota bacterium]
MTFTQQQKKSRIETALRRRIAAALALSLGASSVGAQPDARSPAILEEVVVTAELRETNLMEQASSTSVVDAQTIQRRAAVHLENILAVTPNVNISGGSSRARFYQVRGIGERSQFVEPLNPSVGLLIDDMDFSGLGTAATLFDIEQVEVLRGPQGTLHGANALAGLINMRSNAPSEEFTARVQATAGDYGRRELGAVISGALGSPSLLGRLAAFKHESDGFIDNGFLGVDDTNNRDEAVIRGKLRWFASEDDQLDLTVVYADVDNGYDAFSLDNTRTTLSDEPGRDAQESNAIGLKYSHAGNGFTTEIYANLANTDSEYSYDEDWSFVGIAPDLEYSSFDRYLRERDSASAQLRIFSTDPLSSPLGDVDWTAGVYSLRDEESLRREYTFADGDFLSDFEVQTLAAFGQLDFHLSDRWTLSTGLRLANRDMDYSDSSGIAGNPDDTLWGGKIALQFENNAGMFYAQLSRGYRAGGVNASILGFPPGEPNAPENLDSLAFFDEELLYNYEIGHKGVFLDGRLRSSLALFYMDRDDQQVRGSLVIPRDDGSAAFIDFTDNAASGYNMGLEWEAVFAVSEALSVYSNIGLLEAEFEDYVNADGIDLEGREQAHAPSYQFAVGATYRFANDWEADLQWEGRDAFYFSDRHEEQSDSYSLLHARLTYQRDSWSVALWGRNLADEDYFIRGFGSFGNDPRKGYVTEEYVQFGEPRQIGITLDVRL